MEKLPLLENIFLKSFLTITRGVKIEKEGIQLSKTFRNVEIDKPSLERFSAYMGWKGQVPLPYYYIMAQRAQAHIMLSEDFTIALPGMIHLSNELEILKPVNSTQSFDITSKVNVEYKEEGSLIPLFEVTFYQNDNPTIICKSTYLAKRKSKKTTKKARKEIQILSNPDHLINWKIEKGMGKSYGRASGDKNPIHTSNLFAKIVGFRGMIMQGWYMASRIVFEYEKIHKKSCNYLHVDFISPLYMPSTPILIFKRTNDNCTSFQIIDNQTVLVKGKVE